MSGWLAVASLGVVVFGGAGRVCAQGGKAAYPSMAPVEQYLMDRSTEVALARSAAVESVSKDAEVMVMGRHGYEVAEKGTNGFVCMVLRSWIAESSSPEFWNPKVRSAICFNAAATRTYLPMVVKKTELILAGRSKEQMVERIRAAMDAKELAPIEPGAMCFMLSKQSYLNDEGGHWRPHLMFFAPLTEPAAWGADLKGSPIIAAKVTEDRLTIFMVPVAKWSDGTPAVAEGH
jgi:hypothetical protein